MENSRKLSSKNIRMMAVTALMTAVLAVLSPLSIPIGPVPITLAVLVVCIFPYVLGWRLSALAVLLYLALGALGLPVFSGFEGGIQKLIGPTGGYLVGYIPLAIIGGLFVEKFSKRYLHFIGLALGVLVLYALGTAWLSIYMKIGVGAALGKAVLPFIPFDLAKIALAVAFGPIIKARLMNARE